MTTKQQVIDLHLSNPALSSGQIAEALDCGSEYVRATLKRNSYRLMRRKGEHGKAVDERVERVARWRKEIAA